MSDKFVDTNVLLYLASDDTNKADIAEQLLRSRSTVSTQVLNEFAQVARRKIGLTWPEIDQFLLAITRSSDVQDLTLAVHQRGMVLARNHNFHIYDATIVAAALEAGCRTLYTEDMHNGLLVEDRLRIVNPFV